MEKDKTIIDLLKKLESIIDFGSLEIVDYWDADLCAIGIKKKGRLVYISTFNYVTDKLVRYDVDLEIINKLDKTNNKIFKEIRGSREEQMINELRIFLKV